MRRLLVPVALFLVASSLIAADAPPAPPPPPWQSTIGAGLALTSGNTDTKNFNFSFNTKYDPKTRLLFKAEALYLRGDANGVKQVDKTTANAREEYTISDRTFAFGEVSYLRDPFKAINYFLAPLVGAGYRLINTDVRHLSVDAALGAQTESNTGLGRTSGGAAKAGEDFDWALSPSSKITQKLSGIWKTSNWSDALYHFDAGLTTSIVTRLDLKFSYTYDYKNKPPLPTIKKGDSALVAAVVFKF